MAGKPVISDLINIRDVPMNSNDLREWQAHMGFKSALAASKALGVTDKTYRGWIKAKEPVTLSRTVALACSALAMNIPAWDQRNVNDDKPA